ncbi:hypothetical protein UCREL1_10539 [Eutypa lata UCREL1]|uniref:Uncharacterized protein n=1 Tax=Eutypa lata (strain UCR-EL1) TaxID=1287681 RepID=M7T757_EUTLA|nr:hypothetical protein UCREL1_10539 [Eutypa lata UCREL1]
MSSSSESKEPTRRKSNTSSDRSSAPSSSGRESKGSNKKTLIEIESKGATKKTLNEIKGISKFIEEDRAKGLVRLTSTDQLQDAIDAIQNKSNQHLTLLASRDIEDVIEFHVPSSFRALSVYRCYHEQDKERRLLISGASTFRTTRLDEWQGKKHSSKHAIYLGDGVSIKVEMTAVDNPWSLLQCAQSLSDEDMQEVKRNLSLICQPCGPGEIWWKKIMGPMATIMGLITGKGGKTPGSFAATAAGINVEYHLGTAALTVATAGMKSHTLYTAAGPAAMLGFGAAMVAYVIPWDSVFMWLKGVFAKLYQGFLSLWRSVFAWISEKLFGNLPQKPVKSAVPLRRTQSSRR